MGDWNKNCNNEEDVGVFIIKVACDYKVEGAYTRYLKDLEYWNKIHRID